MKLSLQTPPLNEPLTLDEVKSFLKLTSQDEDSFVLSLIAAARARVESMTGRALLKQGWILEMKPPYPTSTPLVKTVGRALEIRLPLPPLLEVLKVEVGKAAVSFKIAQDTIKLSEGFFDQDLKITFSAGYGETADSLPPDLKIATLMTTRFLYEGGMDPSHLLQPYKVYRLI